MVWTSYSIQTLQKRKLFELKKAIDLGSSIVNNLDKIKKELEESSVDESNMVRVHKISVMDEREFNEINLINKGRHGQRSI